jgi:hypothetical protein
MKQLKKQPPMHQSTNVVRSQDEHLLFEIENQKKKAWQQNKINENNPPVRC